MWHYEEDNKLILKFDRCNFGLDAVNIAAMGYVLIRTYKCTKLSHIYLIASLFLISSIFDLLGRILSNWYFGCTANYELNVDKCPGSQEKDSNWAHNIRLCFSIAELLKTWSYLTGNWIFAFKYL
jgi:hypothetical protein